ncbi:membrane protein DedA, SNARE-associated domain [Raineyella antarctica]|uniref:Membrane protein DedA, SNARE-associated domain n=1 Tax=Raineyella antarctica TaxID=1577474 RepID=A0A1G6GN81_9ACTN|nr:VTT domain-containing protein [Raineyella antarctica]SDB83215.1 membrane protein DedA, SNARE-associated domain [Raineyella antarctica]
MLNDITAFILGAATSVWGYLALVPFIIFDAVVPVVPSESLVISMASVLVHGHRGLLLVLFLVSALAAWCGDNIAYQIGRMRWLHENRLFQRPKIARAFAWARKELFARGATLIIIGRFIPGVRIAINMMCGLVGYSRHRYRKVVAVSSSLWAMYCVLVGSLAGAWFEHHQFLGIVVAIAAGMALGPIIDWVLRRTLLRGSVPPSAVDPDAEPTGPAAPEGDGAPSKR